MKPTAKHQQRNQLRIIGGKWRGRKLDFPTIDGLRPTGDRIRETVFNWLAGETPGARCLDLFAGSGALGFEAASRGASHTLLIDSDPTVFSQLKANKTKVGADNIDIVHQNAINWLQQSAESSLQKDAELFDVLFLDPPFQSTLLNQSIDLIDQSSILAPNALIYIETPRGQPVSVPIEWQQLKQKNTGQVSYYLYRRAANRSMLLS